MLQHQTHGTIQKKQRDFFVTKEHIPEEPQKPKGEKMPEQKREAFVFLDDNPMEVESVRQHLPEVKCSVGRC